MSATIRIMGQMIRELRLEKQLTLEEAAQRAGCTPGFLSQVERNQAVPSITMLYAIANGLGVEVTRFFPAIAPVAQVVRAEQREALRFEGSYLSYSPLSTGSPRRKLQSLIVQIDPLHGALPADELRSHPGEEYFYVLEGSVRFWIGGDVHDLQPGDSVHIESTVRHRMMNPGSKPALCYCVLTPTVL